MYNFSKHVACVCHSQEALAQAFEHEIPLIDTEKSYFTGLSTMLERKRDVMAKLLTEVGFKPIIPQGGYFMMADTSEIGTTQFFVFMQFRKMYYYILASRRVMV